MEGSELRLFVSVPIASFRRAYAREYWETYRCPPPATLYGMLLSVVGEGNRLVHRGVEIAVALLSVPRVSVVVRKLWRVKEKRVGLGIGKNARPEFQELLTGVRLSLWVRRGDGEGVSPPLVARLQGAFSEPAGVWRFGGLSLGESAHLVDEIRPWRETDGREGRILVPDDEGGDLVLPIWADHVASMDTKWGRFTIGRAEALPAVPPEAAWIAVEAA
ncbi:MAG: type I-MYXAN CRISPR-associated protein Cas5/Cmx5/DevS [Deltaproteobacteria bacterium]|nr:MAG: type I-MYXAN CRISPR-associated protein Cas5/Cmx5/DevS [Deltaproteobacteria bacterium]